MFVLTTMTYITILLWAWVALNSYLQWINYKGRFKFRLLEGSKLWRWLQEKVGWFSLVISFAFSFALIAMFALSIELIFNLPSEFAFISAISLFF